METLHEDCKLDEGEGMKEEHSRHQDNGLS